MCDALSQWVTAARSDESAAERSILTLRMWDKTYSAAFLIVGVPDSPLYLERLVTNQGYSVQQTKQVLTEHRSMSIMRWTRVAKLQLSTSQALPK